MKAALGFLLPAALLICTAHSLQCYSCRNAPNSTACSTITNCSVPASGFCMKVVDKGETTTVSKSCEALCRSVSGPTGGIYSSSYCCSTDLCNGASSMWLSSTAISLAASVGYLLLRVRL
ncbi:lymphocyte antigen 6E-like [Pleurodeles waltl]|uniref:lymphocyte antigen 6E-like n=1 Tax=Pleurodeles waltl TaxID=8319 RepID=UPI003709BB67